VTDGTGFGTVYPLAADGAKANSSSSLEQLPVQPGENDLSYSVSVTYFLR